MENNKPPTAEKKSSLPPRTGFVPLGTLGTTVSRDNAGPARLSKLIRSGPDMTLGGVKKREYKPNIPLTETKTESTTSTQHAQPIRKSEQKPRDNNNREKVKNSNIQPKKQKPFNRAEPTIQKTSTSTAASPFASGPPGSGSEVLPRQFKAEVSVSDLNDMDFDTPVVLPEHEPLPVETKKKAIVIDPANPSHPISLPFSEQSGRPQEHFLFSESELFLFQLPSHLPIHAAQETQKIQNPSPEEDSIPNNLTPESLDISQGKLGKITYYKSGRVVLRIGNFSFEVTQGTESSFLQQAAVVSTSMQQVVELGQVHRTIVCSPDIDSLVQSYSQHKT